MLHESRFDDAEKNFVNFESLPSRFVNFENRIVNFETSFSLN